jgi:L-2-hydroxyglutarate oxidase LhgO
MPTTADFVIIGGGIVGLTIARALRVRYPDASVVVFEKEPRLAAHASGRNSGVIHSGIYYAQGSLKARICAEGGRRLAAYCDEHGLPIKRVGKLIIPLDPQDGTRLETLQARGQANGANFRLIDEAEIRRVEPEARSADGRGLYNPDTPVLDPVAVVEHVAREITASGVPVRLGERCEVGDGRSRTVTAGGTTYAYGHLINAAGAHADTVAHAFGVGERYRILPFRGFYYKLRPGSPIVVNGLIYPVPDLRFPFLGVHATTAVSGTVYFGPTAMPAFGRENYRGLEDLSPADAAAIIGRILQQYVRNPNGFRHYLHAEAPRLLKPAFMRAARGMLPRLTAHDLVKADKYGIRAQLFDRAKGELEMDFVIEPGPHSTHVLNAVSPAFTCSLSFADLVVDGIEKGA